MNVIKTNKVEIILMIIAEVYGIKLDGIIKIVNSQSFDFDLAKNAEEVELSWKGMNDLDSILLEVGNCPKCGAQNLYINNYCGNCGVKFKKG